MFLIMLITVSVAAFFAGFFISKTMTPKIKFRRLKPIEATDEYKNFLSYNGDIQ